MPPLNEIVYWSAPLYEAVVAAAIVLALLAWLGRRALRVPPTAEALAAMDPDLAGLPLVFFTPSSGVRALTDAAAELPGPAGTSGLGAALAEALDDGATVRVPDWPAAGRTLLAVPVAGPSGFAAGALGIVVTEGLARRDPAGESLAEHDALGADLRLHRTRPSVLVRREGTWVAVDLSHLEDVLLRHLVSQSGATSSAEELFAVAWPEEPVDRLGLRPEQRERLRRLVWSLRQRIEPDPARPRHVRTAHGVGYALYRDAPARRE